MIKNGIDREALQLRLLSEIFSQSVKNEVVLKGDMAMRVAHSSVRYTKDIDLDAPSDISPIERIRSILRSSIKNVLADGLIRDVKVTEPKQTETTLRWKINGRTLNDAPLQLTIEVSRRSLSQQKYTKTYQSKLIGEPIFIEAYDESAMCESKIKCLLSENRFAVRDVFDLDVLIKAKCQPSPEMIDSIDDPSQSIKNLWNKLETMSFSEFTTQVAPSLPVGYSSRFTEEMYDEMRIRVGSEVEKWIKQSKKSKPKSPGF